MVICNACGTHIADKMPACPKCGAPIDATNAGRPKRVRKTPWAAIALIVVAVSGTAVAVYLLVR